MWCINNPVLFYLVLYISATIIWLLYSYHGHLPHPWHHVSLNCESSSISLFSVDFCIPSYHICLGLPLFFVSLVAMAIFFLRVILPAFSLYLHTKGIDSFQLCLSENGITFCHCHVKTQQCPSISSTLHSYITGEPVKIWLYCYWSARSIIFAQSSVYNQGSF